MIIGLTGGIASGKTFVAKILKELGCKIFDSDMEVKKMFEDEKFKKKLTENFGKNSKKDISNEVFKDKKYLKKLENLIYPQIEKKRKEFLKKNDNNGNVIVFDSPKLIESQVFLNCDYIIVVISSENIRKERSLQRKNMTLEKFNLIKLNQISDEERTKYADFVINGMLNKEDTINQVKKILENIK